MKNVLARSFNTPQKLLIKRRADHGHSAGRSSAKRGGSGSAGARGAAPASGTWRGRRGVVTDRVGGQEHFRRAAAVREVGSAAEARRQNPSEGGAAGIHSGELLIAGEMESGYGRRAVLNFAHKLFVLK